MLILLLLPLLLIQIPNIINIKIDLGTQYTYLVLLRTFYYFLTKKHKYLLN